MISLMNSHPNTSGLMKVMRVMFHLMADYILGMQLQTIAKYVQQGGIYRLMQNGQF
jgi:hypothetical protein